MDLLFDEKCIIFVLAKRREPIDKGFSPLFSCENAPKNHCFTKHIEKFICRSGFSNCFCGNFSGQVGARIDDIGTWKVKRYLFSTLHFFYILGNYSGSFLPEKEGATSIARGCPFGVCLIRWLEMVDCYWLPGRLLSLLLPPTTSLFSMERCAFLTADLSEPRR